MYEVIFYEDRNGKAEILDFLGGLKAKAPADKNARIQLKQAETYIQLLSDHGTRLGENITKHLEDGIWELRPGNNRIMFFCFENGAFVLLHHFRKKTQKTPRREIGKAKAERNDYEERYAREKNENME